MLKSLYIKNFADPSIYENYETEMIGVNKKDEDSWNYLPGNRVYLHKITINGDNNYEKNYR